MKIVATILFAIVLVSASVVAIMALRNGSRASMMEALRSQSSFDEIFGTMTSSKAYNVQAGLAIVVIQTSILGLIATYSASRRFRWIGAVLVGLSALAFFVPLPGIEMGDLRSTNYLIGLIALAGAVVLGLHARQRPA